MQTADRTLPQKNPQLTQGTAGRAFLNPQRVNDILTEAAQGLTPAVAEAWLLFSKVQVLGLAEHQPLPPEELVRVQGKTGSWLPLPRELV